MKQIYTTVILFFFLQLSFGQIAFQENIIISDAFDSLTPISTFLIDIDGDGDLDVLSASSEDNKVAWYENIDGQGTFGNQKVISNNANFESNSFTIGIRSIYASDIDGDGDVDVFSASFGDDKIAWYENIDGLGNFGLEQIISINADGATSVYTADIDGDGDLDVIYTSRYGSKLAWFENINGQGVFSNEQVVTNVITKGIEASDVDGDGDIDLISGAEKVRWYENVDGLGNFNAHNIGNLIEGSTFKIDDIDNDGDIDIISNAYGGSELVWFENIDGLGSYSSEKIISTAADGVNGIYSEDFDNDGDIDIITISIDFDYKISWYENIDGLGVFSEKQVISSDLDYPRSVCAGDIDSDGDIDALSTSGTSYDGSKISWHENIDGLGGFLANKLKINHNAVGAISVYASDIDGDGNLDVISASNIGDEISWYKNIDGLGVFEYQEIIDSNANGAKSVFAADIDNDSDIDVLAALGSNDDVFWYENIDGEGSFIPHQINIVTLDNASSVYASDLDGDGDLDVLSSSSYGNSIVWFENTDGLGNFGPMQTITSNANRAESVYAADLDNDGDMDVLSASSDDDTISWYENIDGLGNFVTQLHISTIADGAKSVYAADIDGDGDVDVLSASFLDNKIAWYENISGVGDFSNEQIISINIDGAFSVHATDVDNDGDLDVLSAAYNSNEIVFFENQGSGLFSPKQIVSTNANEASSVYAADINNDSYVDILSASYDDDKIAWYKNLGVLGNEITGEVLFDLDSGGCDSNDVDVRGVIITADNGSDSFSTFTQENGHYQLPVNLGEFEITISNTPYFYVFNPTSQNVNFLETGNTEIIDFCITANQVVNDLNIAIYPHINEPRPGFDTAYQIVYNNIGTTQLNGNVTFEFDDSKLQFLNASETVSSQTANTLTFDFTDLNPFETRIIDLEFNVFAPPITNIDDVLVSTATVNPISGDETEEDNVFTLNQTVIGSYDPNDIAVLEGEQIFIDDANKYLHYLIRFQNTGTASAININVENVLDDKLDWTTMQLESLSHNGRVEISNGSNVSFIFNNINLPDSTNDEPNSHGFIAYKIKPRSDVEVGDIFYNTADIFFDFNPAIVTNTVSTEIVNALSVSEFEAKGFLIYPNPVNNILTIEGKTALESIVVYDVNGRQLKTIDLEDNQLQYLLDVSVLSQGIYFIEVQSGSYKSSKKFIKE